jgi:hypothetical protein
VLEMHPRQNSMVSVGDQKGQLYIVKKKLKQNPRMT